jgi:hypothetical protein
VTRLCEERAFIDSFREHWKDKPGFTWTAKSNPDFNETSDRIDFVHYRKHGGVVELIDSGVIETALGWPSDHHAVLSQFHLHMTKRKCKL